MAGKSAWPMAWTLARRELRGGIKGLRVLLACLALGVFAIAAAGSTRSAVDAGLSGESQRLLGGDLTARMIYRAVSPEQRQTLTAHGPLTETRELRAMARANGSQALVELKAVDSAYPLYGTLTLSPAQPLAQALASRTDGTLGAVAEPALASRLGLKVGDRFKVGDAMAELTAVIDKEPDRVSSPFSLGPRLMIALPALATTGLEQPGSLIHTVLKLKIEDGTDPKALAATLSSRFPEAGWQIGTAEDAAPGLERILGPVALFLVLVGLSALLTGGIGVGNAVTAFVEAKVDTIATLKTLGAPSGLVFRAYALQIGLLSLLGIGLGIAAGAAVPLIAAPLIQGLLPAEMRVSLYPAPLALAAGFGILTAATFGLWPLARTRDIPAAALFRSAFTAPASWPKGKAALLTGLSALALAALTVASSERPLVAIGFVGGAAISVLLFGLLALSVKALARLPSLRGRPALRLALANLHRPGAPTSSVVLSLGLGLSALTAVALIQANLARQIGERMPTNAPAFFFIDIQPDQKEAFEALIAEYPEARLIRVADMVRGRIVGLKGHPIDETTIDPDARWAVRGDRGLTTAAEQPEDAELVAGQWWPKETQGTPQLSVAEGIAKGLGVTVGDSVTLDVLGLEITGTIANLRRVDWSSLSMNFAFMVDPAALEGAPRTYIATVAAPPSAEDRVETAVVSALPNVSAIRVRQTLESVQAVLQAAGNAVTATAAITLFAGALVLAGAIAAGHRRRVYDAVVLKVLGATRGAILRGYLMEYGVMGAATAVIACGVGTLGAWATLRLVMKADWVFLPGVAVSVGLACLALTLAGGFFGTWRALAAKPAPILREP